MSEQGFAAVDEPATEVRQKPKQETKPKKQPRYNVILWDDDEHSYEYVISMMRRLFGHTVDRGFVIARKVDASGKAVCLTTTREHAELKRDQIHAFGRDHHISRCEGSMKSTIEPVPED